VFFILANNNAHFTVSPVINPPQTASELITSYQNFPLWTDSWKMKDQWI
jgi:hypothetical protein